MEDVLKVIEDRHVSGDFHCIMADDLAQYFEPRSYLEDMLRDLNRDGKKLILASNSPFWYVDTGIIHVLG